MNEHRYILEPYKGMNTRFTCPNCGKHKVFVRYIDMESGEQISDHTGRCNREIECGYHYTPKQYFNDNGIRPAQEFTPVKKVAAKPSSFISFDTFSASLKGYEVNNFAQYLARTFGEDKASNLISRYFVGTSKHWPGATVFWQVDAGGKIRTGKIMLYNVTTGKREKEPFNHITWVHKATKQPEFVLNQCFFGEHLLRNNTRPVAIVESEKTALIASEYLPQFVWLASGSLSNLSANRCEVLKGMQVVLFPDIGAFDKWSEKANELKRITDVTVSSLLEDQGGESEQGFDLADYLARYHVSEFRDQPTIQEPQFNVMEWHEIEAPIRHKRELQELETFFNGVQMPEGEIRLNDYTRVTDVQRFVSSHLAIARANKNLTFKPYCERLNQLKEQLCIGS